MANEIVKDNDNFPAVAKNNLDAIAALCDNQIPQLKLVEGGFRVRGSDKFVKEILGTILDAVPYLIRFEDKVAHKLPHVSDDLDIPDGYERRCDLRILVDDQVVGLSLAPTSMRFGLSPYIKYLRGRGFELYQVTTKLMSQQVTNQRGTWNTVVFEFVEDTVPKSSPETPRTSNQPQDRIPQSWR